MFKNKVNNIKVETIFCFFAFSFGFIFVFATAPFAVADESSHFLKAWDVSQGNLIQKNSIITVPKSIGDSVGNVTLYNPNCMEVMSLERNEYLSYFNKPLNIHETSKVIIANINKYPFVPYILPAFVLKLGEFLKLSPLLLLYLTRLINLLLYTLICYIGIKLLPCGKYTFLLITLMPMTLSQAASVSADSLNNALSFLVICLFLKLALNRRKIQRNDVILLSLSLLAIGLSKQIYILLGLLFFIIPKSNFIKHRLLYFLSIILPSLVTVVFWNLIPKYYIINDNQKIMTSSIPNGLHLLDFLNIVICTIINKIDYILTSFVGYFGWLSRCYPLPLFLVYLYLIILVVVSILENNNNIIYLSIKQKIISVLIFLLGSLALFTISSYWEPIGSRIINGIQGRYFIPFALLFFLILQNNKLHKLFDKKMIILVYYKIFVLTFIFGMLSMSSIILYYGHIF